MQKCRLDELTNNVYIRTISYYDKVYLHSVDQIDESRHVFWLKKKAKTGFKNPVAK